MALKSLHRYAAAVDTLKTAKILLPSDKLIQQQLLETMCKLEKPPLSHEEEKTHPIFTSTVSERNSGASVENIFGFNSTTQQTVNNGPPKRISRFKAQCQARRPEK